MFNTDQFSNIDYFSEEDLPNYCLHMASEIQ